MHKPDAEGPKQVGIIMQKCHPPRRKRTWLAVDLNADTISRATSKQDNIDSKMMPKSRMSRAMTTLITQKVYYTK